MNFMNHETRLDLRQAESKKFGLLLKLIFYNSFEVITGFPCLFTSCRNVIWGDERRTPARAPASHSASPDQNFLHRWVTKFSYPWGSARLRRNSAITIEGQKRFRQYQDKVFLLSTFNRSNEHMFTE